MDSVHHVVRLGAFSGSPYGPSVSHLRQDYNAPITNMKLKPGVERLNKNDYFNLLVSLTTGGARDQATALERELIASLAERKASARRKYERDLAEYDRQMLLWDARTPPKESSSKDKEAEPPKPPVEPEELTEYADPMGKLWKLFEKLYPERSKSRTDEFTQFQLRPNADHSRPCPAYADAQAGP
jgi:ribosomal protein S9